MGIPVSGGKPPIQNIQPDFQQNLPEPPDLKNSMQDLLETAKMEAMTVDKEVMHMSKEDLGVKKKVDQGMEQVKEGKQGADNIAIIEALAALLQTDEVDKKRKKKKTKFEEKLEELEGLEGLIDKNQLPDEDRQELEKLFDNLARIKQSKAKLKQLEDQEEQYENRFEAVQKTQKGMSGIGMEEPKLQQMPPGFGG